MLAFDNRRHSARLGSSKIRQSDRCTPDSSCTAPYTGNPERRAGRRSTPIRTPHPLRNASQISKVPPRPSCFHTPRSSATPTCPTILSQPTGSSSRSCRAGPAESNEPSQACARMLALAIQFELNSARLFADHRTTPAQRPNRVRIQTLFSKMKGTLAARALAGECRPA